MQLSRSPSMFDKNSRRSFSLWLIACTAFLVGLLVYVMGIAPAFQAISPNSRNAFDGYQAYVIAPNHPGWQLGWMTTGNSINRTTLTDARYQVLPTLGMSGECEASASYASFNGKWVAIQINCEAGGYVQVLEVASGNVLTLGANDAQEGEFLEWTTSEDELVLLIHGLVADSAYVVNVITQKATKLNLPETVYDVTLSPDRQRIIYSTTKGLGFGSETWLANADGGNARLLWAGTEYLVIFPRWSPDGNTIAYIRMPDSSEPFVAGELWLADRDGQKSEVLYSADAGHGFRPIWSPDSTRIAFVVRDNPDDTLADFDAEHLSSNAYVADLRGKTVENVSQFDNAHVDQPVWSPDGNGLAFGVSANGKTGLWQLDLTTKMLQQIADEGVSGVPIWIAIPDNSEDSK